MAFNNIDSKLPQKVHVRWTMETPEDDFQESPDERDEGFWPSQDKGDPGYVLPENFESEMRKAEERMQAWRDGQWRYVGVVARADILIPIGGSSFRTMTLRSAGLWGIESDAGDYLQDVFEEEKACLLREIKTLGLAATSGDIAA